MSLLVYVKFYWSMIIVICLEVQKTVLPCSPTSSDIFWGKWLIWKFENNMFGFLFLFMSIYMNGIRQCLLYDDAPYMHAVCFSNCFLRANMCNNFLWFLNKYRPLWGKLFLDKEGFKRRKAQIYELAEVVQSLSLILIEMVSAKLKL